MADPLGDDAAQRYGRSRLSNVVDTVDGKLDPAQYLRKGRHEEWTLAMSGSRQRGVPVKDAAEKFGVGEYAAPAISK